MSFPSIGNVVLRRGREPRFGASSPSPDSLPAEYLTRLRIGHGAVGSVCTLLCVTMLLALALLPTLASAKLALSLTIPKPDDRATSADAPLAIGVPQGNAADDARTSAVIMHILSESARAIEAVQSLSAQGTSVETQKYFGGKQVVSKVLRFELAYERPWRVAVLFTEATTRTVARFVADGSTVLMEKRTTSLNSRDDDEPKSMLYRRFAQPPSLAPFAEEEYPGEIVEDITEAVSKTGILGLLLSPHPLEWLHAHVVEYVFEGVDPVAEAPCYRIRFIQTEPDLVVVNWIDARTFLPRKVSVIRGMDERGRFVASFADAYVAEMRIATLESLSTAPLGAEHQQLFQTQPSPGSRLDMGILDVDEAKEPQEPFLMRLLRAAAAQNEASTTISLETERGGGWHLARVERFPVRIAGISTGAILRTDGSRQLTKTTDLATTALVISGINGDLYWVSARGIGPKFAHIVPPPDILVPYESEGTRCFAAGRRGYRSLRGVDEHGTILWEREYQTFITSLDSLPQPDPLRSTRFIAGSKLGAMFLTTDGTVTYMNCRVPALSDVAVWSCADGAQRIAAIGGFSEDVAIYQTSGTLEQRWKSDGRVLCFVRLPRVSATQAALRDPLHMGEQALAVVGVVSSNNDMIIRAFQESGEILWSGTVQLQAGATHVNAVAAKVRERRGDSFHPNLHLMTLTGNGTLCDFDERGRNRWRGYLVVTGGAEIGTRENFARTITAADLDGDGNDELYVVVDKYLIVLMPD